MRRERQRTLSSSVLIGAVTVLVAIVAVVLAYNANNSLPFVPTRELKVDLANAAAVQPGDQVNQGGFRVGLVSDVHPIELANGTVGVQVLLELSQPNGRVPIDSTATIRPVSVLGLKYVELMYGRSPRVFPNGGTMPLGQTSVPVQFDDIYKTFDSRTRSALERNLVGIGGALTARGSSLNDAIGSLPTLLGHLSPVARYLSDPHTELTRLVVGLNRFFGTVSPVAETAARLFRDQATTFAAISEDPNALRSVIQETPPTLEISTNSLRAQQPLLTDLTTFADYAAPDAAELRAALPNVNPALEAGVRTFRRTPSMNQELQNVLDSLGGVAKDPGSNQAVNGVAATVKTVDPVVRYLGPYVTVCNAWNYLWVQIADVVSEQTSLGMAQRALLNFANQQQDSVGTIPASQPADGQHVPPGQVPEFLHGPAYGAAVDTQGNADCEAGQRGFPKKLNKLDPHQRDLDAEQYTPGDQGATWTGLARVPPGQTYSRRPTTGPQLPLDPNNQ